MNKRLHYRLVGEGMPIVLTTGLGADSSDWAPYIPILSKNCSVLVWDYLGHGKSERSEETDDYVAEDVPDTIKSFIHRAGGSASNPAILIGHSLGGYNSLRAAIQWPDLVRSMILISTGPGFKDESKRRSWNEWVLANDSATSVSIASRRLGLQSDDLVLSKLNDIVCPVLLIVGGQDDSFIRAAEVLEKNLPHVRPCIIQEGGHNVHRFKSQQVIREIQEFITVV